jgi:3-deoxy-D-manno-octulosonic-acid transferase|tara:strand:- start:1247 stop:2491 length:1245 start_codon:yes stop_codon:yes gene_type:complete
LIPKLYNLGIALYGFAIRITAFKNQKAKLWIEGRKNTFDYLEKSIIRGEELIWIHAPSLGEFEQARPLIEQVKSDYSKYKILLTFYSPSGYEIRKDYPLADYICYLPLDTKENAKRFVNIVNPAFTFFVKYDFWANYLNELQIRKHKHYVISAIFRSNQFFFKKHGKWMLDILAKIDHFFVQNEDSKYMLLTRNITQVSTSGDTRFDRVIDITKQAQELPLLDLFKQDKPLFIGGSTWQKGEELIVEFAKHYGTRFKYVIAPHEIHSEQIEKLRTQFNLKVLLYSEATEQNIDTVDVLIINNIGLLSSLYAYADIAYIGGGFGKGIHNTLEAATFGMPIFIGPKNGKFQEAQDLKDIGVAQEIKSAQELIAHCDHLFTRPKKWLEIKEKSKAYVKGKSGATLKIINHVFKDRVR